MDEEEVDISFIELPIISDVLISHETVIYASEINDFVPARHIVLKSSDGTEYRFLMSPTMVEKTFRIPPE